MDWYAREMDRLGVTVCLGQTANEDMIKEMHPDAVALSVGSDPVMLKVEGAQKAYTCIDVLNGEKKVGNVLTSIWSAFEAAKEV